MKKLYLTWGTGYGSKLLAEQNALADANLTKAKIKPISSLVISEREIIDDRTKIKSGEYTGLLFKKCARQEAVTALNLGFARDKIIIGVGKGGAWSSAETRAKAQMERLAKEGGLELEPDKKYSLVARAPMEKNKYGCAVVALILE